MFDGYRPAQNLTCPVCDEALVDWEGKEGPCALFVWKEGEESPIDQLGGDMNCSLEERAKSRLPEEFDIYSYDCSCVYPIEAICNTNDGVWNKTIIINSKNAFQKKHERKSEFKERLKWLQSNET